MNDVREHRLRLRHGLLKGCQKSLKLDAVHETFKSDHKGWRTGNVFIEIEALAIRNLTIASFSLAVDM
jgi:hypothetical protein